MKQGTAVHKTLEEQVHATVAVDVRTKEDSWGLRIWNVIQGLRTLRETGMTRELEIWGTKDGQVVNGVIDELSYICPDRELEHAEERKTGSKMTSTDQTTITEFLGVSGSLEANGARVLQSLQSSAQDRGRRVYLMDVKTRGVKTLPKGPTFRPTQLQLMLYHQMLSRLSTNDVEPGIIFNRHNLDFEAPFTDGFIAQVGSLNEDFYDPSVLSSQQSQADSNVVDSSKESSYQSIAASTSSSYITAPSQQEQSQPSFASTQDSMAQLLNHNSVRALWDLMIQEFNHTFPRGARSLGNVLKAEYRDPSSGEIKGDKTFMYDEKILDGYLQSEMQWWRGERAAEGVNPNEAFKCGSCEFFDECSWRKNKIEDAVAKMRDRRRSMI